MNQPSHIKWFEKEIKTFSTTDGKKVSVIDFSHQPDEKILTEWAAHFRNHYCSDSKIDVLRKRRSRKDYLVDIKFPSIKSKLGPPTRAGDFAEILVADYVQWLMNYWVPRVRWDMKYVKDSSPQGSDIIGFKVENLNKLSNKDGLIVVEAKAQFSATTGNRLLDAVVDSAKDEIRLAESLNYIKERLLEQKREDEAGIVERFENPIDFPYRQIFGAAVIISNEYFDTSKLSSTDCTMLPKKKRRNSYFCHPNLNSLVMFVIKGDSMMPLVHDLYRRAADEA